MGRINRIRRVEAVKSAPEGVEARFVRKLVGDDKDVPVTPEEEAEILEELFSRKNKLPVDENGKELFSKEEKKLIPKRRKLSKLGGYDLETDATSLEKGTRVRLKNTIIKYGDNQYAVLDDAGDSIDKRGGFNSVKKVKGIFSIPTAGPIAYSDLSKKKPGYLFKERIMSASRDPMVVDRDQNDLVDYRQKIEYAGNIVEQYRNENGLPSDLPLGKMVWDHEQIYRDRENEGKRVRHTFDVGYFDIDRGGEDLAKKYKTEPGVEDEARDIDKLGWEEYFVALKLVDELIALHQVMQDMGVQSPAHMDLKPENIIMDDDGNVSIIDFDGIYSGMMDRIPARTSLYTAPETEQNWTEFPAQSLGMLQKFSNKFQEFYSRYISQRASISYPRPAEVEKKKVDGVTRKVWTPRKVRRDNVTVKSDMYSLGVTLLRIFYPKHFKDHFMSGLGANEQFHGAAALSFLDKKNEEKKDVLLGLLAKMIQADPTDRPESLAVMREEIFAELEHKLSVTQEQKEAVRAYEEKQQARRANKLQQQEGQAHSENQGLTQKSSTEKTEQHPRPGSDRHETIVLLPDETDTLPAALNLARAPEQEVVQSVQEERETEVDAQRSDTREQTVTMSHMPGQQVNFENVLQKLRNCEYIKAFTKIESTTADSPRYEVTVAEDDVMHCTIQERSTLLEKDDAFSEANWIYLFEQVRETKEEILLHSIQPREQVDVLFGLLKKHSQETRHVVLDWTGLDRGDIYIQKAKARQQLQRRHDAVKKRSYKSKVPAEGQNGLPAKNEFRVEQHIAKSEEPQFLDLG